MKNDFQQASLKIKLFEEQALVTTLIFAEARIRKTIAGSKDMQEIKFIPSEVQDDFIAALNKKRLGSVDNHFIQSMQAAR